MNHLCKYFKLDPNNAQAAWKKFKNFTLISDDSTEKGFWKSTLELEEFRTIHELIETYLTIPFLTLNCERIFSRVDLIKSDLISCLSPETLDLLFEINLN